MRERIRGRCGHGRLRVQIGGGPVDGNENDKRRDNQPKLACGARPPRCTHNHEELTGTYFVPFRETRMALLNSPPMGPGNAVALLAAGNA